MKHMRFAGGIVWILLTVCFFVMPLILIYQLSQKEMAQYQAPEDVEIVLGAYGKIVSPYRTDIQEYITVSGSMISDSIAYQELTVESPGKIRWTVSTGAVVVAGEILGYYGEETVCAEFTGRVSSISTSQGNAYIRYDTFEKLLLECRLGDTQLSYLKGSDSLTIEGGNAVTIERISPLKNADGTTTVQLHIEDDGLYCGQSIQNLIIYTGRVYPNVLVIDVDCVYRKYSDTDTWYVRQVDAHGVFIAEREVQIGYANEDVVCISGISEDVYIDSGYKAVVEGS